MDSSSYQRNSSGIAIQVLSVSLIAPDSTPSIRYSYPIAILRDSALLVYNTWHKGGTWLAGSLFRTLSRACRRSSAAILFDSQLEDSGLCDTSSPRRARESATALVHLNSASYVKLHVPVTCIAALPRSETRFIHFIRSPFAMVASFFLYHSTGEECGFSDMLVVCDAMRRGVAQMRLREQNASSDDHDHENRITAAPALVRALRLTVDKLLTAPLPQMTELHVAVSGMAHVLTLRMESFELDFDGTSQRLLAFLGIAPGTSLHTALRRGFQEHDVRRWNLSSTRPHSALARHVTRGRSSLGLTREAVLAALAQDAARSRRLSRLSRALGYT